MRKTAAEAVVERLFEVLLGAVGRVTEQLLYIGIEGDGGAQLSIMMLHFLACQDAHCRDRVMTLCLRWRRRVRRARPAESLRHVMSAVRSVR